jgi:hypothetical protein
LRGVRSRHRTIGVRDTLAITIGCVASFSVEGELGESSPMAIEVVITLDDGRRRLAHFATPDALKHFGDWVPGTQTRFHVGLIVLDGITHELIRATIEHLDREGRLLAATRPAD